MDAACLWVLAGNGRARRFYERQGWSADGATRLLDGWGNPAEARYERPL